MKTFNSSERSGSFCRERLVKQDYLSSFFFFVSIWIVFLLSGPALGYSFAMPLIMLHQCDHSVIIPAAVVV